jgi:hypothetical protein
LVGVSWKKKIFLQNKLIAVGDLHKSVFVTGLSVNTRGEKHHKED